MGCDIHCYAEARKSYISGGQKIEFWEKVENFFKSDDYEVPYWGHYQDRPFRHRNYGLFGFLGHDGRNYSHIPEISELRGLPDDLTREIRDRVEGWGRDAHSHSWLMLSELEAFDYDVVFWDKRVTRQISSNFFDGAAEAREGEGRHLTFREFLGQWYFDVLGELQNAKDAMGADDIRIVFWFDN